MQPVLVTSLSVLMLSVFLATIAQAEFLSTPEPQPNSITRSISPNDLVSLAYRGAFRDRGIPGYTAIAHAYTAHQVTARDLVQVAIDAKKLPSKTLSDPGYLNVVDTKLADLNRS